MTEQRGSIGFDLETRHRDIRAVLEQGEVERAAELCLALLHEYPGDLTGHALMGDIHAARRHWAEAADWYSLAEQMGGGRELAERHAAAQAMAEHQTHPEAPMVEVGELHRRRLVLRSIFVAAGVVVLLAVVIALVALFSRPSGQGPGRSAAPTPEFAQPTVTASGELGAAPGTPASVPPSAGTPGGSHAGAATVGLTGGAAPLPHAPVVITRLMTAPATDEDFIIAQAVSGLTWPGGLSMSGDVSVMMDPHQGYGIISFRIPETLPTDHLYDTVVQQSYRAIQAGLAADAGLNGVTVRVLATLESTRGQEETVQAFRANTTRESVNNFARVNPNPPPTQLLVTRLYGSPWWDPQVPPGE